MLFEMMIWAGAAMTLLGLAGIIVVILRVRSARKASQTDEELKEALLSVLPLNLGALFLSVIGLMLVTVGVILG